MTRSHKSEASNSLVKWRYNILLNHWREAVLRGHGRATPRPETTTDYND